ncbi:hypothetical protein [Kitasatospora azatica]|nr:hypothetical protein [Kitasatospora azatica]
MIVLVGMIGTGLVDLQIQAVSRRLLDDWVVMGVTSLVNRVKPTRTG